MPINKVYDKNGKPVKKDGKQKYRVRINYTDTLGRSKQIERTAYGSDEAKRLERELSQSVKAETPAANLTVGKLYEEYIAAKKHEIRASTMIKKQQIITLHVLPYLAEAKLDKLTAPVLQKWKQDIESEEYSIRTRKNIYSEFRAMLNFGVKMDYLSKNPLLKVGNFHAPLEEIEEMKFYTPDEFLPYINAARNFAEKDTADLSAWGYYVFFCIAFFTGMRKGEINALTWRDIRNGEISITKSLNQKLSGGDQITPPKNKSSVRTIQIPNALQAVLSDHYNRSKNMANFSDMYNVCGGIRALRDSSIANANERFALAAGVKTIRIHDFRHSHASYLISEGINIQEIARRLGHADVSITLKTYAHLYPKESERALNALNKLSLIPEKSPKK